MRILVLSDIHAMSADIEALDGYGGPSGGMLRSEKRAIISNPLLSIADKLGEHVGKIDLLICLGDIAHQARRLPLLVAWRDIHDIATALNVNEVLGIIGNHDVMSRADSVDEINEAKEFLQSIRPDFPSQHISFNTEYFAHGVAKLQIDECTVIAVDTCRTHGYGLSKEITKEVFETGVLTDRMIDRAIRLVNDAATQHILVAMHHHPIRVYEEDIDDEIKNGRKFLEALEDTGKNIFVVHGHKHFVKVQRFSDHIKSPIVFSSASLCAYPYPGVETYFSNQFHVVDFDSTVPTNPVGQIFSWDWGADNWQKSTREHMPHRVYFGVEPNLEDIANQIFAMEREPFIPLEQLNNRIPTFKYVSIEALDDLNSLLHKNGLRLIQSSGEITGLIYEEERR